MPSNIFPYAFGPQGRSVSVDADGRVIAMSEDGSAAYVYGYGDTGRPLVVDASGRLIISSLSNITASGTGSTGSSAEQVYTSGGRITDQAVYVINNIRKFRDKLYVGTKNWFGSASGAVYAFWYDETAEQVQWEEAFNLGGGSTSGWPATLEVYHDRLYTGPMEGAASGWIFEYDGTNVSLVGAVSGHNSDTGQQASVIFGMGLYDNKLVISIANNLFTGPHPIFYYDGTNFGEVARMRTTASQWGWIRGLTAWNNKLYSINSADKYVNIFDGIRSINVGSVVGLEASVVGYKGKLYFFGAGGVYEFNETDLTFTQVYSGGTCDYGHIYNGNLYFVDNANVIKKFDGQSFNTETTVGASVTGIGDINGRLFIVCTNGAIYTHKPDTREALSHGKDDTVSNAHYEQSEYIKKLLDYTGSNYRSYEWWSTGSDVQRYPVYTSTRVIAQSDPLSSGVSKLDTKLGDQAMPPSGWDLPSGASYGDQYYHQGSGFHKFGEIWNQLTTITPHYAELWVDTTPTPGETVTMPTAEAFVRFISVAPSGGQVGGHGLSVHSSGILVTDAESAGHYRISYSVSFDGTANSIIRGALFINESEQRCSKAIRKLSAAGDVGNMGSSCVLDLDNGDDLSIRFAATANSKSINIQALNLSIGRIHKH